MAEDGPCIEQGRATYQLLKEITNNFSMDRQLGQGASGRVYMGELKNGKKVAVKLFRNASPQLDEQIFKNEFENLMMLKHQNTVQFVGYCYETQWEPAEHNGHTVWAEMTHRALCFEYLHNGNLKMHLDEESCGIDWNTRYKIIKGTCDGLKYIHKELGIYHLDLKPENILLDEKMVPKLADFGFSKIFGEDITQTITNYNVTRGYVPPEYVERCHISNKFDIFSLGVVIIKIVTGPMGYSKSADMSDKDFTILAEEKWRNRLGAEWNGSLLEAYCQQVKRCIELALNCVEKDRNKRPSIEDIIEKLNETENLIYKLLRNGQQQKAEEKWRNRLGAEWNGSLLEAYCLQVKRCIELALNCMEKDRNKRPNIEDIVEEFNETENLIDKLLRNDQQQKKWLSGDNGAFIGNLFQFVRSFQWSTTQEPKLHEDYVMQLQSDLQCLYDTLPAIYHLIHRVEWSQDDRMEMLLQELRDAVYDAEDLLDEFRWYEQKVSVEGIATSVHPVIDFFRSVTSFNKVSDIQKRLDNLSNSTELGQIGLDLANTQLHRPETTSFITEPKVFGRDNELEELMRLLGVPSNGSGAPKGNRRSGVIALTGNQVVSKNKERKIGNQVCTTLTLDIKYETQEDEYGTREDDSVEEYGSPKDGSENEYRTSERDSEEGSEDKAIINVHVLPIVGTGGIGKTTLAQTICNSSPVRSHFDMIIWICVSDDFDVKRLTKEAIISSSGREATTDRLDSLQQILADNVNKKRLLLILDDMCIFDRAHWKRFCAPFANVIQGSMMLVTTRFQQVADLVCTMDPFPLQGLHDDAFWDFFKKCVFGPDSSGIDPNLERIGKTILPKLSGSPLAAKSLGRLLAMRLDPQHWNNLLLSELWQIRHGENDILPALRLSYKYLPFYLKRCFSFCAVYPKHYEFEKVCLAEIWVAEGFVEPHGSIPILDIGCKYFEELVQRSFFQTVGSKYVIPDLMHEMARLFSKDECFIIKNFSDIQKVPQNVRHLSILQTNGVACSDLLSLGNHRKLRTLLCKIPLCNKTDTSMLERWCAELRFMRVIVFAQIRELPKSIGSMKHLRYLEILRNSHHLERLPSDICCLYNLQRIYARKCVFDNVPSRFARLINLQRFEALGFKFNDYPSESLPTWFHPQYIPNIRSLSLNNCNGLECISLRRIRIGTTFLSLVDISIENCKSLSSLEQFLQPAYIPATKRIVIAECPSLELIPAERFGDLSFLEVLKVCNCPKIKSRRLLALSLKKLELKNSGNLGGNIECCSVSCLHLSYSNLASIELQEWNLPVLQELKISHCSSLKFIQESKSVSTDVSHAEVIKSIGRFPLITHLTIEYCDQLETLDDQLLYLPAIESINISFCVLLSLPTEKFESFSFLKDLTLSNCVCLSWESGTELPLSLKTLSLQNCGDISTWFTSCLENLTSLESLHFGHCDYLLSIPDHLWSCNLKSLKKLWIESCPDLEMIGGPTAIANIENVWIADCPKLEELNQPLVRGVGFDRSPLPNIGCGFQINQMDNMKKTYEQLDPENTVNSVREALLYDHFNQWLSSKCEQNIDGDHLLPKQYHSIIHMIAALGHVLALKPLLSSGVLINYRDVNGWTALHWAARFGREGMVAALLAAGAAAVVLSHPTPEDPCGKTPASIASAYGFRVLSAFLSEVQLLTYISSIESKENGKVDSREGGICRAADRISDKSSHMHGRPYDQFVLLEKAALYIQKNFRCWKKRIEFLRIRNNVIRIQARVRAHQERKKYKELLSSVGVLEKVMLRWYRKGVGLRGFNSGAMPIDEEVDKDVAKVFRNLRVETAINEAVSRVSPIIGSPKAMEQYRRMLKGYQQEKILLYTTAALSIQKNYRRWKIRKAFLGIRNNNIARIQARVRDQERNRWMMRR